MENPKDTVVVIRDSRATVALLFTAHVLLLVIAFLLFSIYRRLPPTLPPTLGDLQDLIEKKNPEEVQAFLMRQPLVRVTGEVNVRVTNPSLDVELATTGPLAVNVMNEPMEVVITDRGGRSLLH